MNLLECTNTCTIITSIIALHQRNRMHCKCAMVPVAKAMGTVNPFDSIQCPLLHRWGQPIPTSRRLCAHLVVTSCGMNLIIEPWPGFSVASLLTLPGLTCEKRLSLPFFAVKDSRFCLPFSFSRSPQSQTSHQEQSKYVHVCVPSIKALPSNTDHGHLAVNLHTLWFLAFYKLAISLS